MLQASSQSVAPAGAYRGMIMSASRSRSAAYGPPLAMGAAQQQHAMSDSLAKELYERGSKAKKVYAAKKAARKK